MKKLLIADTSEDFLDALTSALQDQYDIRTCTDGEQALFLLRTFAPDGMILDMMLPCIDGVTLLQKAAKAGIHPVVLATVRHVNYYMQKSVRNLNVGYTLIKPCGIDAVRDRLNDLMENKEAQPMPVDVHELVYTHFLRLGIKSSTHGFQYLCYGMPIFLEDPDQSVNNELYPAIAAHFPYVDAQSVEHSIRRALHTAWENRDESIWLEYLQPDSGGSIPRPQNQKFLKQMSYFFLNKLKQETNS